MKPRLTIAICTHNPRPDYLQATLAALRTQAPLEGSAGSELLLIDNGSAKPLAEYVDLSWHPDARVIREERLGLTHARLRSFREASAELILFIDDDNVLETNYARTVVAAFDADPTLGAVGGKSLPQYETQPPPWFDATGIELACRDLGDVPLTADWKAPEDRIYPECAPIGAGMGLRRAAYTGYVTAVASDPVRSNLGRKGSDLASGEDNDMILTLLEQGWRVAYLPDLVLHHLIPAQRLSQHYLDRYAFSTNRTWVQVLHVHGINPWPPIPRWTLPLRKLRAWMTMQAWRSPARHIAWRGACGTFEGRASIAAVRRQ